MIPGPTPARFPKLIATLCLLATAGSAAIIPPSAPQPPLLPVLPAAVAEPVRYGMRVQDERFPERIKPFRATEPSEGWLVVGASGQRWRLPDALPAADVQVSPDGRKLAYYSLTRMQVVIHDITTGALQPVPTPFYEVRLSFSPDSRLLAMEQPEEVIVTDTRSGAVRRVPGDELLVGWAGDRLVLSHSFDGIKIVALDASLIAKIQAPELDDQGNATVSPDGKEIAVPSGQRVLILGQDGKVLRKIHPHLPPTAELRRVYRWAGPTEVVLYAPGYRSATIYVMNVHTGATRPVPYAPEVAGRDITIGAI
uniref:Uncharacterized protein n=1 Tax=Nonomuraea gerenzanensis TaxID=93944 RepID=A0A1M4EL55_9ACTN|nr:hypothetical protein BN4615_P9105 [Nonomuraea gerenzanensis]